MSYRASSNKLALLAGLAIFALLLATQLDRAAPRRFPPAPHARRVDGLQRPLVPDHVAPRVDKQLGSMPKFGYVPAPRASAQFVRSLPQASFAAAAPDIWRNRGPPDHGERRAIYLYRALFAADPQWIVERQQIGDCVSHGWRNGVDALTAVAFALGESGEWRHAASEPIYGGSRCQAQGRERAGYSDGSYGAAAAKWVKEWGVLYRQPYGPIDLSVYSGKRAKEYGNSGCPHELEAFAREHPVRTVSLVTCFEEAAAAIANGYPVPVCSNQGFSSRRDRQGFAHAQGSWSHCMVFIGVRWDRPGLLCLNSWGPSWIDGPKDPPDQIDGSFWVDRAVAEKMLRGNDSFAVSNFAGFPPRKLNHADGWSSWIAPRPLERPPVFSLAAFCRGGDGASAANRLSALRSPLSVSRLP